MLKEKQWPIFCTYCVLGRIAILPYCYDELKKNSPGFGSSLEYSRHVQGECYDAKYDPLNLKII